jgi:SAM-dependent methyltransferase
VDGSDGALDAFRHIYETDHWNGGSGEGSAIEATEPYRRVLESVVAGSDVRSIVDAGCGDWQFSRLVDWSGKRYVGVDIVPEVVAANRAAFGGDDVDFVAADIRTETLPAADLLLCKDVLQHWDVQSVQRFLARNLARYRYALITNDLASVHSAAEMLNAEIPIGHWRPLDPERVPFGLTAQWRFDFDIRGEWTKRSLLFVRARNRFGAALRRRSALRLVHENDAHAPGSRADS